MSIVLIQQPVVQLSQTQQDYIWSYVCGQMVDGHDECPTTVFQQRYGGDRHAYLVAMAEMYGIVFCAECTRPFIDKKSIYARADGNTFCEGCRVCIH